MEGEEREGGGDIKIEVLETRNINFMEKSLHSPFMRKSFEVESQKTWNQLKTRTLKKTEGMIMV